MHQRIISCQGSTSLLAALAALRCKEQGHSRVSDQNFLVIHSLHTPQFEEFERVIRRMAAELLPWRRILSITPQSMRFLEKIAKGKGGRAAARHLRELLGIERIDSLFLMQNWHFGNQLLMNAYPEAEKVCFGDGLGSYSGRLCAGHLPAGQEPYVSLRRRLSRRLKTLTRELRCRVLNGHRLDQLADVDFDVGYFAPLNGFKNNGQPSMPYHTVDRRYLRQVLCESRSAVDRELIARLHRARGGDRPCTILLGENLSECGATSREREIALYRDFVLAHRVPKGSLIVFKPHPRDDRRKITEIERAISHAGYDTFLLDEPESSRLPFELLFSSLFLNDEFLALGDVSVLTSGFPAISLMYLFGIEATFGYGDRLIEKYIEPSYVEFVKEHEQFVREEVARWRAQKREAA